MNVGSLMVAVSKLKSRLGSAPESSGRRTICANRRKCRISRMGGRFALPDGPPSWQLVSSRRHSSFVSWQRDRITMAEVIERTLDLYASY